MIPKTCLHEEHETMLQVQDELAEKYKYKALPPLFSMMQREEYETYMPDIFRNYNGEPVYTLKGICICKKLTNRIYVCGDYGIFLEADKEDMLLNNLQIKKGQEYRIYDPQFIPHVKYHWMTTKDNSDIKIYYQQKTVDYADYLIGKYYFSPYEATIKNHKNSQEGDKK